MAARLRDGWDCECGQSTKNLSLTYIKAADMMLVLRKVDCPRRDPPRILSYLDPAKYSEAFTTFPRLMKGWHELVLKRLIRQCWSD